MTTPLTPEEEAALRERLASVRALGLFEVSSGLRDFTARLLATLDAARAATPAAPEALRAGLAAMQARADDLRWCNKDDDCHTKAEGADLVIEDFRAALAAASVASPEGLDVERLRDAWEKHRDTGHHPDSTSGCFPGNADCLTAIAAEYVRLGGEA